MAWERRDRGGLYYTRSRRRNGRIVREYVGGGLLGESAAAEDAERHAHREAQRVVCSAEQQRLDRLDTPIKQMETVCGELMRRCLEANGYHRRRGEWRKNRGTGN